MKKHQYFVEQLEMIGRERLKLVSECESQKYEVNPSFRYKDFKMKFEEGQEDELLKSLGRQAKNRLLHMAGIIGWYDSWVPKFQKSRLVETRLDLNPESPIEESPLFDEHLTPTASKSTANAICFKSRDYEQLPAVICISHASKRLLEIYRTKHSVRTAIQYAKDCGLVEKVSDSYKSKRGRTSSYSKKYAVNTVILALLKSLCRRFGIVVPKTFTAAAEAKDMKELVHKRQELYYKVRLGKSMRTPGLSKDEIASILSYKYQDVLYPMLKRFETYNEGRPEEQRLHFSFNIHVTNGYNTKNGCRAWSYAGLKPTEEKAEFASEEKFEEYFEKEFGARPWEYDVHASVFKMNRGVVKTGAWEASNGDAYAVMFPGVHRKTAKSIAMLFMFEHSGRKIDAAVMRSCPEYKKDHKDEIDQVMRYWYGYVHDYIGDSLGNLVFLLEDSFYSTVDVALKRRGYKFLRKFDCWCFPESHHPESREMDKILADCFKTWHANEAAPCMARLRQLENSGVKELKKMFTDEITAAPSATPTTNAICFKSRDTTISAKPNAVTTPGNDSIVKSEALSCHHHHQHQSSSTSKSSSHDNIDRTIRDNSDIPDEDSLTDTDKRRQEALQKLIDEQVMSRRDASWLYFKLYDEEHAFKESRRGWCIEDRLKAKPARTCIMNTLVSRYPSKFTRKDVMNFIGAWL